MRDLYSKYRKTVLRCLRDIASEYFYKVDTRIVVVNEDEESIQLDCYFCDDEAFVRVDVDEYIDRIIEEENIQKIIGDFIEEIMMIIKINKKVEKVQA